jgi:hypothetical protein
MCRGDYWVNEPCSICGCRVQCGDPWHEYPEAVFLPNASAKVYVVECEDCHKKKNKKEVAPCCSTNSKKINWLL